MWRGLEKSVDATCFCGGLLYHQTFYARRSTLTTLLLCRHLFLSPSATALPSAPSLPGCRRRCGGGGGGGGGLCGTTKGKCGGGEGRGLEEVATDCGRTRQTRRRRRQRPRCRQCPRCCPPRLRRGLSCGQSASLTSCPAAPLCLALSARWNPWRQNLRSTGKRCLARTQCQCLRERVRVRGCVRPRVRECVCACVRACVRARVYVCMRAQSAHVHKIERVGMGVGVGVCVCVRVSH